MTQLTEILSALPTAISQGLSWAIMAVGIFITFKILNIADMTCDGSIALGGCVCVRLIIIGYNPFLCLILATLSGMLAGLVTGLLYTKLKIPAILAGILSMISLYSINLRILKKPNQNLLKADTIISLIREALPASISTTINYKNLNDYIEIAVSIIFCIIVCTIIYWFFGTELGCALRATGNNEDMIRALGQNTDLMKILGLIISNGLIALSGAIIAQSQGYGDVTMGQGAIVIGLASIVIGEIILGRKKSFLLKLFSVILGSVLYRIIIAIVLQLGLNTDDQKILSAIIIATALSIPVLKKSKRRPNNALHK